MLRIPPEQVTYACLARLFRVNPALAEQKWRPRGGIECALLDMLVQSYTLYLHALQTITSYAYSEMAHGNLCEKKCGHRPDPEGIRIDGEQHAFEMAERWNRIFLRTLRQLRDLRRYNVMISAQQVNIGGQQVNTTGKNQ